MADTYIDQLKRSIKFYTEVPTVGVGKEEYGLCTNAPTYSPHVEVCKLTRSWPEYSGDITYPVPSTNKKHSADQMYNSNCEKYSKTSKYGKSRLALAKYLADGLTKILDQELANET
jgi:hypothetical protein